MSLAEKFQITIPAPEEKGEGWASFNSARCTEGNPRPDHGERFNEMPDVNIHSKYSFAHGFGGNTDVTGDVEPSSLLAGFKKREMKATDDQYTGEHVDLFYGDAGGFVERNNYMDRE